MPTPLQKISDLASRFIALTAGLSLGASCFAGAQGNLIDWDDPANQWDYVNELAPEQDTIEHLFTNVGDSGVNFTLRFDPVRGDLDRTSLTDPDRDSLEEMLTKNAGHAGINDLFDFYNPDTGNDNDPDYTLNIGWNEPDRDDGLLTTFSFSQAVSEVSFDAFDIDKLKWSGLLGAEQTGEPRGWIDHVTITGYLNGLPVAPQFISIPESSTGSDPANIYEAAGAPDPARFVQVLDNTLEGRWEFNPGGNFGDVPNLSNWATNGTYGGDADVLTVSFPTPVDSITIEHQNTWSEPNNNERDKPDAYWGGSELEIGIGDIGFEVPEIIRDRVWIDLDQDGMQDPGEPGLPGVDVQLLHSFSFPILVDGQPVIATTGANGSYYITPPNPGDYKLQVTPPAGFVPTSTNAALDHLDNDFYSNYRTSTITISPGQDEKTVDAGFRPRGGAFSETIFADANADGIQNAGETGLAGVVVNVLDASGSTIVASSTTGPEGIYYVDQLDAGDYFLEILSPPGFGASPINQGSIDAVDSDIDPATNRTSVITLGTDEVNTLTGAGFYATGSIGDYVFLDDNGDGDQDADNDFGLAGVTVILHDGTGNNPLQAVTSGPNGEYLFSNLAPDTYVIEFVTPAGFETVQKDRGDDDMLDSDYDPLTGKTDPITITAGRTDIHIDAGFRPPNKFAQIGDRVWNDDNENGIQDAGEEGMAGITVALLQNNGNPVNDTQGNPVITTTTATGYYNFVVAPLTSYRIEFLSNPFASLVTPSAGTDPALDSDPDPLTRTTGSLPMAEEEIRADVDAGFTEVIVGDTAWIDLNRDGVRDTSEPGLGDVMVELLDIADNPVLDANGQPITATTEPNGNYRLTGFLPGVYKARFTAPAGYVSSPRDAGPDDTIDNDADATGLTGPIDMTGGLPNRTIDAGYLPPGSALGDCVFSDENANGIHDPAEPGIAGVTVNLLDGSGSTVLATTTTNVGGYYYFDGLEAASYVLEFITPDGYGITAPNAGDDAIDSDIDPVSGRTSPVALGTNETNQSVDAGFFALGSIGDFVFYDKNHDGKQDPDDDFGLPGVTVVLHDASGTNPLLSTVTTPDGAYRFDALAPGTYVVEFVTPKDFLRVVKDNGDDDALDSDYSEITGKTDVITLNPGQDIVDVDAGFEPPDKDGIIGDLVWEDFDSDGLQDPGEPGVGGTFVELLESDGAPWLDDQGNPVTTTTLPDGSWFFVVKPADYRLRFTPPADMDFTTPGVGSDGTIDNDVDPTSDRTAVITINDDDVNISIDAGIRYASISGRVWSDTNGSWSQDPDEPGIPNVRVFLDLNGNRSQDANEVHVLTDLDGYYRFGNLLAGTYTVQIDASSLPVNTLPTYDPDSDPDGASTASLGVGERGDFHDFGFYGGWASIEGQVRNDLDSDGDLADLDSGLASITIELYRDNDLDGRYSPGEDSYMSATTTDAKGFYSFQSLTPGHYVVREIQPGGATSTNDADNDPLGPLGTDNSVTMIARAGLPSTGHDFLDNVPGQNSIAGSVIDDANGNSANDSEPGIPAVRIDLMVDANGDGLANEGLAPYASTHTDATGAYQFTDIPNGNWVVVEHDPAGASSTNDISGSPTDNMNRIGLPASEEIWSSVDFYDTGATLRRIQGFTTEDSDDDNEFSVGDTRAAGVPVKLFVDLDGNLIADPGEPLVAGTVSDETGHYEFPQLPSGNYVAVGPDEDPIKAETDSDGTDFNEKYEIAVMLGDQDSTGNNFLVDIRSIGGQVREDTDADGDLKDDEPGIAGVTIHLYIDANLDQKFKADRDILYATTTTNLHGHYAFVGLTSAYYLVVEVDPPGATSTNDTDSPLLSSGTDNVVFVNLGGNKKEIDFLDAGVTRSTLSGQVRNDLDGDGNLADPEPGIGGVPVTLFTDPDGNGDPEDGGEVAITITDLQGVYTFPGLIQANYVIVASDPPGAASTNDKDNNPLGPAGTDNRIAVSLDGAGSTGNDFLDSGVSLRTIRGQVFDDEDLTDNNTLGPEDIGIGGVTVSLYADRNGNGLPDLNEEFLGSTYSGNNGSYSFTNLLDGLYAILQQDPPPAQSEDDTDGDPLDSIIGISLNGSDSTGNNFLDDPLTGYAISGRVTDGTRPIAAVRVTLLTEAGIPVATAYSDSDGGYTFANMITGTYMVAETNPAGTTGGSDADGGDPDSITVTLGSADSTGHDFVDTGAILASITGSVFEDGTANNNLIDAEDTAVGAVPLELILDSNGDGNVNPGEPVIGLAHTRTDGVYTFSNLPEGSYVVRELNPANATSDMDTDGPANGNDMIAVTLSAGSDSNDNSFLDDGIQLFGISGNVSNGASPIPGVELRLRNQAGHLIDTAASNTDGNYLFPNLIAGIYVIEEINPIGTSGGSDADGPDNGDDTIIAIVSTTPVTGQDFTDIIDPGSFHAIDGHGSDDLSGAGSLSDPNDRPVDGMPVSIYRDIDLDGQPRELELVGTSVTDDFGNYRFEGLPDGAYLVVQNPLPGCVSTPTGSAEPDNGEPSTIPVSLTGGDTTGASFAAAIDPGGYFYDTITGEIISGGRINVTADGLGIATVIQSGVNGQYSFVADGPDTYTIVVTPPDGYSVDPARTVAASSDDPTGRPDPDTIGSIEDVSRPGYLVDASAGANPYYLVFDLEPGDPLVLSNNIPLRTDTIDTFSQFLDDLNVPGGVDSQPVPDQSGSGGNPDGDIQSNLLEYALTEDPATGASPNHGGFRIELVDQATGRIDVSFTRHSATLDLIYTIQTKDALTGSWNDFVTIPAGQDAPAPFSTTPNGDGTETLTYSDIVQASGSGLTPDLGFVRLLVALDTDQDGNPDTLADGTPVIDHTKTFGWQSSDFNTAQTASFSHPFSNAPVFSGTIDYVQGAAVNVATSSNNFDLSSIIGSNGSHYLQVTSGPLEGQRFDIAGAAVIAMTLVNDPDIFSDSDGVTSLNTSSGLPTGADLAGHSFMVVPHLTVDQLFDKNAAFAGQASGNPSSAAKLFFYNNRSDTPGLKSLLLVDLGTEQRWIRSNDFAQLTDQGTMPIDRCAGTYVYPGLGPITNQFAIGMVADHAVAASFNTGYNLAGSPYPLDQTPTGPDGRAMTVANGFVGGVNPTQASAILLWTGDFAVDQPGTYVQGYDSYMQLDGGGMQRWIDVSDQQLNDLGLTLLLESHRALTVKIGSGSSVEPHVYPAPLTE